jgi:hypothetical protein
MSTTLTEITHIDLEDIAFRMRESDRVEIFNLKDYDNPYQLAWEAYSVVTRSGRGRIAWWKGRPTAVFAFTAHHANLWDVWMFGTDEFRNVAIDLLRYARREANEILTVCNAKRLQCDAREGHPDAHKMLRAMGGVPESTMRFFGKDGGHYVRYVWINGENDAVLKSGYVRADKDELAA